MNPDPAYADTIIRAWLAEPVYFPPQDLGHIAALVHETPQRRSRWSTPPRRSRSMFSVPKMITAAAVIGMAGWFLTAGVSSPSPDLVPAPPAASLEATTPVSPVPSLVSEEVLAPEPGAIDWQHPAVRLQADRLRIDGDGLTFRGPASPQRLDFSELGRHFDIRWRDHGRLMQLLFYFGTDRTHWWIDEIRAYDGTQDEDWVYYRNRDLARDTRTRKGATLRTDLDLKPDAIEVGSPPRLREQARLRIDGMRLTAYGPGTEAAPLEVTGCRALKKSDAVVVDAPSRVPAEQPVSAIDYFADGAILEGVDELTFDEAAARLSELGICHEFEWSYELIDDVTGAISTGERWCTVPPVVRPAYDRPEPFLTSRGQVSRFPFTVSRSGHVKIYVEDLEPRAWRMQPPAGWGCPTR